MDRDAALPGAGDDDHRQPVGDSGPHLIDALEVGLASLLQRQPPIVRARRGSSQYQPSVAAIPHARSHPRDVTPGSSQYQPGVVAIGQQLVVAPHRGDSAIDDHHHLIAHRPTTQATTSSTPWPHPIAPTSPDSGTRPAAALSAARCWHRPLSSDPTARSPQPTRTRPGAHRPPGWGWGWGSPVSWGDRQFPMASYRSIPRIHRHKILNQIPLPIGQILRQRPPNARIEYRCRRQILLSALLIAIALTYMFG